MNPTNRIAPNYDPPSLPFPQHMAYDDPGEPVFAPQPSAAVLVAVLAMWVVAIAAVAGGLYLGIYIPDSSK